jgi:hypothetical protein
MQPRLPPVIDRLPAEADRPPPLGAVLPRPGAGSVGMQGPPARPLSLQQP